MATTDVRVGMSGSPNKASQPPLVEEFKLLLAQCSRDRLQLLQSEKHLESQVAQIQHLSAELLASKEESSRYLAIVQKGNEDYNLEMKAAESYTVTLKELAHLQDDYRDFKQVTTTKSEELNHRLQELVVENSELRSQLKQEEESAKILEGVHKENLTQLHSTYGNRLRVLEEFKNQALRQQKSAEETLKKERTMWQAAGQESEL
eukprot:gene18437-24912_t